MLKPAMNASQSRSANELNGELLDFYDDLTATHAALTFVLGAFAAAMRSDDPPDARTATGATFCVEWLNARMRELELRLADIRTRTRTRAPGPGSAT